MAEDDIQRLENSARSAMVGIYDGYAIPASPTARLARALTALMSGLLARLRR